MRRTRATGSSPCRRWSSDGHAVRPHHRRGARPAAQRRHRGAEELTEACLAASEASAPLNAFSVITADLARAQAAIAAERLKAGPAPDLCGIPLGIKDLFCVDGVPAQAASNILQGFRPPYESTVTRQLWEAGAVCIGKLNMDEFAMGSSNETSLLRRRWSSPWRRARRQPPADAGRLVGRLGGGGLGGPRARRHRHRHRRLDPPARGLHRHRRGEAHLRALLALGDRGLRLVARPGRADGPHGARRGDPAEGDGRPRPQRFRPRPSGPCPTSRQR